MHSFIVSSFATTSLCMKLFWAMSYRMRPHQDLRILDHKDMGYARYATAYPTSRNEHGIATRSRSSHRKG